ncbi:MAG: nucleoside:proton symporter [Deltaproteobacteria bacterium]|nr:nucleoside:proton symporter [Deltaproteobacteria bacterium]MBW1736973.1 nucleoside:proton symporter [Deltaproteobacteria bacterium]MBW1908056.1 nucleoside:proton symporter [Deltaproteobacteria bacterium]MBW2032118.1 nucleoside:proton symporter [Deltaproteobacteria bacterium]MBW2113357.1 nucleoside:proton symporter [Deltaproteobacteria bacterium]
MDRLQSLLGFFALALLAWLFSEKRKQVSMRIFVTGLCLQAGLALLLLKFPGSQEIFLWLNRAVQSLEESTRAGTGFVFGYLGGAQLPFDEKIPGSSYVLAFRGLPLVLVISALSSLFFYWRIMPVVVRAFSWVLRRIMGIGGVEGLGTAANIFVGMVESPLFVRPYLSGISRSELFTIMTSGMASIAGTVMVLYAAILSRAMPGVMGHLLTASIISAPAAVTISKLMIPETHAPTTGDVEVPRGAESSMDAITRGTLDGIKLLINIIAMLVVLVALVHLLNLVLAYLPDLGGQPITFQRLLGYLMAPVTWLMGIPWSEAKMSGALMGTKTVLNELLAYLDLAALPAGALSERSRLIMIYAMCGFANFGSLGIMIGGMGAMAKERREELVGLGIKSIVAGTLATCMTGALVGIIY